MGCWNGTCGLTRMPIKAGQPVYGMFIMLVPWRLDAMNDPRATNSSGMCYFNDEWRVASPLFAGKYDDYGRIEDGPKYETKLRQAILDGIGPTIISAKDIKKMTGHEDTMAQYDGDPTEHAKTFDGLVNITERERGFVEFTGKCVPLGLWMAHRWAVDAVVASDDLDAKIRKFREAAKSEKSMQAKYKAMMVAGDIEAAMEMKSAHRLSVLENPFDVPGTWKPERCPPEWRFMPPDAAAIKAVCRTRLLTDAMQWGRIALAPQSGKGSQSDSNWVHKALANAVLAKAGSSWEDEYQAKRKAG